MKKIFLKLLVLALLVLGSPSYFANAVEFGSGIAIEIHPKTGKKSIFFQLPDKYLGTNKKLISPLTISILNNENEHVFSLTTNELSIYFPDFEAPNGNYLLLLEIGEIRDKRSITL